MSRTLDVQNTIELPMIPSDVGVTVSSAIIAAAKIEKHLPQNVEEALTFVIGAHHTLQAAVFSASQEETTTYVAESRAEAAAWSAVHGWAVACVKLKNKKKSDAAALILAKLFAEGMKFIRQGVAKRFVATEHLIQIIKEQKLEAVFAMLGGADFLSDVLETHKALGVAAGITAAPEVQVKSGRSPAFDRWKAAMRCYVAQVLANEALALMKKPDDEAAMQLADRLLHALTTAPATVASHKAEKGGGEGTSGGETAPAKPAAPATMPAV